MSEYFNVNNNPNVEAARKAAEQAANVAANSGKIADGSETFFKEKTQQLTEFTPQHAQSVTENDTAIKTNTEAQNKLQSLTTELRGIGSKITDAQRELQEAGNDENAIAAANQKIEQFTQELEAKQREVDEQTTEAGAADRNAQNAALALQAATSKLDGFTLARDNAEQKAGVDRGTANTDAGKAQDAQTNFEKVEVQAQQEAQEAEAKAKAEEEARIKAEAEAKAKAEEEQKAKNEAEAKARAEELAKDPNYNKDPNSADSRMQVINNKETENELKEQFKTETLEEAYDKDKGKAIADAAKNSQYGQTTEGTGYCAHGVKDILGLEGNHNANEMEELLNRDNRFKEIDTSEMTEEDLKKLGPGCVVVYTRKDGEDSRKVDADVEGMSALDARNTFGHVMITDGEGNEISDHIQPINTNRLEDGNLEMHVYVPVGDPDSNPNKNDVVTGKLAEVNSTPKYSDGDDSIPKGEEGFEAAVAKYKKETGETDDTAARFHVASEQPSLVDKAKTAEKIREDAANHSLSEQDKEDFAEAVRNSGGTGRLDEDAKRKLLDKLTGEDSSDLTKDEVDEILHAKGILNADGTPHIDPDTAMNVPQDYGKKTETTSHKVQAFSGEEQNRATDAAFRRTRTGYDVVRGEVSLEVWRNAGRIEKGLPITDDSTVVDNIPKSVAELMLSDREASVSDLYGIDKSDSEVKKKYASGTYTDFATRSSATSYSTVRAGVIDNEIHMDELKAQVETLQKTISNPKTHENDRNIAMKKLNASLDLMEVMVNNNKTTFDNNAFRRMIMEASKTGVNVNFLDAFK